MCAFLSISCTQAIHNKPNLYNVQCTKYSVHCTMYKPSVEFRMEKLALTRGIAARLQGIQLVKSGNSSGKWRIHSFYHKSCICTWCNVPNVLKTEFIRHSPD
eukprot:sb/3478301/